MQNFERRAIATARHLTQKTRQMALSVGSPREKLPGMLQPVCDLMSYSVTGSASVSTDAAAEFFAAANFLKSSDRQHLSYDIWR